MTRWMFLLGVLLAACRSHPDNASPPVRGSWRDTLGFENRIVHTPNANIHLVDYGGFGTPMVFLAGLGNSAHVFDEFAPRFRDRFHVIGVTRRGFGESTTLGGGYSTDELTNDLAAVLDSLRLDRVILVGHSLAGDEMTELAARSPARVQALVYLDAAYDRSSMKTRLIQMAATKSLPPTPPRPNGADKKSADAYREYLARIYGVPWPLTEVRATRVFDRDGHYVRDVSSGMINLSIFNGERALRYGDIQSRVLAIYATERGVDTDFPWIRQMLIGQGNTRLQADRFHHLQNDWESGERKRLRERVPTASITEVPRASHYVFISNADFVERAIRDFLLR